MRVYYYDENGDSLGEDTDDALLVVGARVMLDKNVFTVIQAGGLEWDAGKNIPFRRGVLRPDLDPDPDSA